MILHCSYEELQALATGAELLLERGAATPTGGVAAPAEALVQVALLRPRLNSALSIETLAEQRWIRKAVAAICQNLHERMEEKVLEHHPAHEEAVAYYFDYAHAYAVLDRLDQMGAEMTAMIELMTGAEPTEHAAETITFSD